MMVFVHGAGINEFVPSSGSVISATSSSRKSSLSIWGCRASRPMGGYSFLLHAVNGKAMANSNERILMTLSESSNPVSYADL